MPDITMCNNDKCPSSKTCYRFMAKPTPGWQSYAAFAPPPGELKCDSYWPTKELGE